MRGARTQVTKTGDEGASEANTGFRSADARQPASAVAAKTDLLLVTNDYRLPGMVIPGTTFITGIERIPY